MTTKKRLCSTCKTGRESLLLDETSPDCPYITRYTGEICPKYVPDDTALAELKDVQDEDTDLKTKGIWKRFLSFFEKNQRKTF
ncbi:MAG: hypothetical protein J6D15_03880 [Clostridia bacterium]|nr:hypothetical protein [Clostridia bacterium]